MEGGSLNDEIGSILRSVWIGFKTTGYYKVSFPSSIWERTLKEAKKRLILHYPVYLKSEAVNMISSK
jgi:hypothetical protein